MKGTGERRRHRRRPGSIARAIAHGLAPRDDEPAGGAAGGISSAVASVGEATTRTVTAAVTATATVATEAVTDAAAIATWAASKVGDAYRVVAGEGSATGSRALRARNRVPLPSLHALYPEASGLPVRSLGVLQVAVDDIAGTAVAGPDQRGSDFRPLPAFRGSNWQARWRRIRAAVSRMESLPPVDLQKYDGRYWVVDGHNRIAAALYEGQVAVDAAVQELVPPGAPRPHEPVSLAAEVVEGAAIRTVVSGLRPSLELRADREAGLPLLEASSQESGREDGGAGPVHAGESSDDATARDADDLAAGKAAVETGATTAGTDHAATEHAP